MVFGLGIRDSNTNIFTISVFASILGFGIRSWDSGIRDSLLGFGDSGFAAWDSGFVVGDSGFARDSGFG